MPNNEQHCLELDAPPESLSDTCHEVSITRSIPWPKRVLKAPKTNRSHFAEPALAEIDKNSSLNHQLLSKNQTVIMGRSLSQLRASTREEIVQLACDYTSGLREQKISMPTFELLYCTGHQPALFHPGVWCKNIAISKAAELSSLPAISLNLIVDQDLCGSHSIAIPIGSQSTPSITRIPYDTRSAACPWEERHILDCDLFRSFGDRVLASMAGWKITPLIRKYWASGIKRAQRTQLVSEGFTAMRHTIEQEWELGNLELPLSQVCQSNSFFWFACHILANLKCFQSVHNEVLSEYRQVNHIRSRTHPVPALTASEDWLEAPFWVWRAGDTQRRPLQARQVDEEVWLADGDELLAKLPLHPDGNPARAMEVLGELTTQGIRLRTRALTTTLFTRLLLADMFVHGIGGSKYDEMTDQIIHRFYAVDPPVYQTLTATLHLPFTEAYNVSLIDLQKTKQQLRDLKYNSDRHLHAADSPDLHTLTQAKQQLIRAYHESKTAGLTRKQRREQQPQRQVRDTQFRELQTRFAQQTQLQQRALQEEMHSIEQQLVSNQVIQNREFAYCLYPEDVIHSFYDEIFSGVKLHSR